MNLITLSRPPKKLVVPPSGSWTKVQVGTSDGAASDAAPTAPGLYQSVTTTFAHAPADGGSIRYATSTNASMHWIGTASGFRYWTTYNASDTGNMVAVSVDGGAETNLNIDYPQAVPLKLWEVTGLSLAQHTFKMRLASGGFCTWDYFEYFA